MNESRIIEEISVRQRFLCRMKRVNDSYLITVIICAAVIIGSIAVAMYVNVAAGIVMALAAVICYNVFSKELLSNNLGISYTCIEGAITVTGVKGNGEAEIFIPARLLWHDVTKIGPRAFADSNGVKMVHIPSSVTEIAENALSGCSELKTIYFEGSKQEWNRIKKGTDFGAFEICFSDNAERSAQEKQEIEAPYLLNAEGEEENI